MNKKDYLEKTKKLAKATRIICRISIAAFAIGVAILAMTVIVAYVVPPERLKPLTDSGKLDIFFVNSLYIPAEVFTSVEALRLFLSGLLARISVGAAIYIIAAVYLIRLLKSVEAGEPFAASNVKHLRSIAITLIVGAVITPSVTAFSAMLSSGAGFWEMKSGSMVDITLLLCGLLILILSGIFAYGARLQREHDQTV